MIKIVPSKLDLAVACSAAPGRNVDYPFEPSEASERGLKLHEATAMVLQAGLENLDEICKDLTEEDKEAVKVAVQVAEKLKPWGKHETWIEQKKKIKELGANGMMDLAYYDYESGSLMVCDWKFGKGEVPDPTENFQLRAYTLTLVEELKAKKLEVLQAYLVICQPCGTVKQSYRDALFKADLFPGWSKEIQDAVKKAQEANPEATPGPHCKRSFCEAGKHGACPEFKAYQEGKAVEKEEKRTNDAAFAVAGLSPVVVESPTVSFPIVVISEEAIAKANELLAEAQKPVTDLSSAEAMGRTLQAITTFEGQVDKNREVAKKPVLDLGRKIDDAAKQALIPLREAKALAAKNVTDWKAGEKAKQDAIQAEYDRKKAEAEKALREAELKRLAAEKALQDAKNAEERKKAVEAAEKAAREQAQAINVSEQVQDQAPVVQAPIKIAGVKTSLEPEFEVTDFAAMPDMFKLTNESLLKKAIKDKKVTDKDAWVKIKWVERAASTGRR